MPEGVIPLYKVHMPSEVKEPIEKVLFSGQIAHGANVTLFEKQLQEYIGNPLLTTTREISSSIQQCLYMAGVRPGDEVLASPMACLATNIPVLNLGAKIRWVDVDPLTGNISADDLRRQISPRVKAILLYHWAGNPVDLAAIQALAREAGIPIVDDAGEAMGAEIGAKKIGNTGSNYTVFSFHAIRHINTGDGAAISFDQPHEYEKGIWLKRYGIHQPSFRDELGEISPASDVPVPGYNNYLNHMEATIGTIQMKHLPQIVKRHQENGRYFDEQLNNISGITLLRRSPNTQSAYWVYTLLAEKREGLLKYLRANRIYASKVHLRNDLYSCFGPRERELPGTEEFHMLYLSIPCGWWVSDEDRDYIVEVIKKGW